jgi:hypothetical protein
MVRCCKALQGLTGRSWPWRRLVNTAACQDEARRHLDCCLGMSVAGQEGGTGGPRQPSWGCTMLHTTPGRHYLAMQAKWMCSWRLGTHHALHQDVEDARGVLFRGLPGRRASRGVGEAGAQGGPARTLHVHVFCVTGSKSWGHTSRTCKVTQGLDVCGR